MRKEDRSLEQAVRSKENTHLTSRPSGARMRERKHLTLFTAKPQHLQWCLTHGRILVFVEMDE